MYNSFLVLWSWKFPGFPFYTGRCNICLPNDLTNGKTAALAIVRPIIFFPSQHNMPPHHLCHPVFKIHLRKIVNSASKTYLRFHYISTYTFSNHISLIWVAIIVSQAHHNSINNLVSKTYLWFKYVTIHAHYNVHACRWNHNLPIQNKPLFIL